MNNRLLRCYSLYTFLFTKLLSSVVVYCAAGAVSLSVSPMPSPLYEDFWGDLDGYFEACRPKLKSHDHSSIDSHLKVAVRCRPIDARERALKDRNIVTPHGDKTVTLDLTRIVQGMESATFAYDHVYGPDSRCARAVRACTETKTDLAAGARATLCNHRLSHLYKNLY